MWINIAKKFKTILDADVAVQALSPTVRIGIPVRNISDSDYPVLICGKCTLTQSVFRGTKDQDRTTIWSSPVAIYIKSTIAKFEDGTVFDSLNTIEDAVVDAILTDASFQNESPYLEIELEATEHDEETQPPYIGIVYRFSVSQINSF